MNNRPLHIFCSGVCRSCDHGGVVSLADVPSWIGRLIPSGVLMAVVLALCHSPRTFGQGSFVVLQTGGGGPLVSSQIELAPGTVPIQSLSFLFGFTSDEQSVPGQFLDSISVSLSDQTSASFLPLVTVDGATVSWAPGGDGTVPFDQSNIDREEIAYPAGAPSLAMRSAWRVQLNIPSAFQGMPLYLYFDLFDNGNDSGSAAWLDEISVVPVPEPATGTLLTTIVLCLLARKWRTTV